MGQVGKLSNNISVEELKALSRQVAERLNNNGVVQESQAPNAFAERGGSGSRALDSADIKALEIERIRKKYEQETGGAVIVGAKLPDHRSMIENLSVVEYNNLTEKSAIELADTLYTLLCTQGDKSLNFIQGSTNRKVPLQKMNELIKALDIQNAAFWATQKDIVLSRLQKRKQEYGDKTTFPLGQYSALIHAQMDQEFNQVYIGQRNFLGRLNEKLAKEGIDLNKLKEEFFDWAEHDIGYQLNADAKKEIRSADGIFDFVRFVTDAFSHHVYKNMSELEEISFAAITSIEEDSGLQDKNVFVGPDFITTDQLRKDLEGAIIFFKNFRDYELPPSLESKRDKVADVLHETLIELDDEISYATTMSLLGYLMNYEKKHGSLPEHMMYVGSPLNDLSKIPERFMEPQASYGGISPRQAKEFLSEKALNIVHLPDDFFYDKP